MLLGTPSLGAADDGAPVHDAGARPTPLWLALQLVPSPELAIGAAGPFFGLRWQVTPLLFSFALDERLSPWRVFTAEPLTRYGGSVEVYVSPGMRFEQSVAGTLSLGARGYLPVVERGEGLSVSLALAWLLVDGRSSAVLEVGAYVLFGVLGLQVSVAYPEPLAPVTVSLSVRYF